MCIRDRYSTSGIQIIPFSNVLHVFSHHYLILSILHLSFIQKFINFIFGLIFTRIYYKQWNSQNKILGACHDAALTPKWLCWNAHFLKESNCFPADTAICTSISELKYYCWHQTNLRTYKSHLLAVSYTHLDVYKRQIIDCSYITLYIIMCLIYDFDFTN